ncbi:MAG: L-seryl-tRNA(Sec) selenium transferase, partial [Desulfatitalea sp.]|nr:L-seryl-tRNA(Sec) selenium transferase [Desulfatitalea sp.]
MPTSDQQQQLLRRLPGVDILLSLTLKSPGLSDVPKTVLVRAIRDTVATFRRRILEQPENLNDSDLTEPLLLADVTRRVTRLQAFNLQRTINATGVIVHTNLGRSCLAPSAIDHLVDIAGHYSNLEFDLHQGRRGSRYSAV